MKGLKIHRTYLIPVICDLPNRKSLLKRTLKHLNWTQKRYNFGDVNFSVLVERGYMGYGRLITAIFHIGLCNKFRDQSSVKGLKRQWVEFQKVRARQILTTKISICVDRRYMYLHFFPDRKSTKCWTNPYAWERKNVQKMPGFAMTGS